MFPLRRGTGRRVAYSRAGSGAAADPTLLLPWSGLWRADTATVQYNGAPWLPTASAGTSGTNGNLNAPVAAPTNGTAQNGYTPAQTNGTTQYLRTANAVAAYLNEGSGTVSVLVKTPSTSAAPAVNAVDDPGIFALDSSGYVGMGWNSSGVRFFVYDGAYKAIQIACSAGAYHRLVMKWDGVNMSAQVDSGAVQSIAAGPLTGMAGGASLQVGVNYAGTVFTACNGYLELALSLSTLTSTQLDNHKSALVTRYGVSV